MTLHCLIPAAGAASRMRGADKLLEEVEGAPCLRVMAQRALAAGMKVIVALPALDHSRSEALKGVPVTRIAVPNAMCGMSASLAAGALALPDDASGLMILPGDMPALTQTDLRRMNERFEETCPKVLRARTATGKAGHPIIFAAPLVRGFWQLTGDRGAQAVLKQHTQDISYLDFDDERPRLDLDTPEDWAQWRASLI